LCDHVEDGYVVPSSEAIRRRGLVVTGEHDHLDAGVSQRGYRLLTGWPLFVGS
jgi:hypothetical protein